MPLNEDNDVVSRRRRRSSMTAGLQLRRSSRLSLGDVTPRTMIEAFQQDRQTTARRLRQPRRRSLRRSVPRTPSSVLRTSSGRHSSSTASLQYEPTPRGLIDSFLRQGEERSMVAGPQTDDSSRHLSPVLSRSLPSHPNESIQDEAVHVSPPLPPPPLQQHRILDRLRSRRTTTSEQQQQFAAALHEKLANIDNLHGNTVEKDAEQNQSRRSKGKDRSRLESSQDQSTGHAGHHSDVPNEYLPHVTLTELPDSVKDKLQNLRDSKITLSTRKNRESQEFDGNDLTSEEVIVEREDANVSRSDEKEREGEDVERKSSTVASDDEGTTDAGKDADDEQSPDTKDESDQDAEMGRRDDENEPQFDADEKGHEDDDGIDGDEVEEPPLAEDEAHEDDEMNGVEVVAVGSGNDQINVSQKRSRSGLTSVPKVKRLVRRKRHHRPRLPSSLTRSIFMHFSERKLTKGTLEAIEKIADSYWENVADDLTSYAKHAGRSAISENDVELLMKRQGLVNATETMYSLVEKYLPYEYREEIIPIAVSGNRIIPDR